MLKWSLPLGAFLITITIGFLPKYSVDHEWSGAIRSLQNEVN